MKVAFLYEHPNWSDALLDQFRDRGVELQLVNVAEWTPDTSSKPPFDAAINRINIMPSSDRRSSVALHAIHCLNWIELMGIPVINGATAHMVGASKVLQNGIFNRLGLRHPRGIAIYRPEDVLNAAEDIGYPVIIKPNIGGSGSGISLFQNRAELIQAVKMKSIDFGVDRTGLVQEYINSDGYVYRVEMLGENLFYSIRQKIQQGVFNYCAADGCSTEMTNDDSQVETSDNEFDFCALDAGDRIETFSPPETILKSVADVIRLSSADVGGIEYFIEEKTGEACFYDFNPYSNFVTNGSKLLGFPPEQKYIEFVTGRIRELLTAAK